MVCIIAFSGFSEIRAAFTSTGRYQRPAEPCQPNKMERNNSNESRLKFCLPPPTLAYKFEPSARTSDSAASTVVDIISAGALLYIDSDKKKKKKRHKRCSLLSKTACRLPHAVHNCDAGHKASTSSKIA